MVGGDGGVFWPLEFWRGRVGQAKQEKKAN